MVALGIHHLDAVAIALVVLDVARQERHHVLLVAIRVPEVVDVALDLDDRHDLHHPLGHRVDTTANFSRLERKQRWHVHTHHHQVDLSHRHAESHLSKHVNLELVEWQRMDRDGGACQALVGARTRTLALALACRRYEALSSIVSDRHELDASQALLGYDAVPCTVDGILLERRSLLLVLVTDLSVHPVTNYKLNR